MKGGGKMAVATVLVHTVECKTQRIREELHSGKLDLRLDALNDLAVIQLRTLKALKDSIG
jgi:hypothetical protein